MGSIRELLKDTYGYLASAGRAKKDDRLDSVSRGLDIWWKSKQPKVKVIPETISKPIYATEIEGTAPIEAEIYEWRPEDLMVEIPHSPITQLKEDIPINLDNLDIKEVETTSIADEVVKIILPSTPISPVIEEIVNKVVDEIEFPCTPEEVIEEARERWLREKKEMKKLKEEEDNRLTEFYAEKHKEFKRTIGSVW
jgi:hypothetical protein